MRQTGHRREVQVLMRPKLTYFDPDVPIPIEHEIRVPSVGYGRFYLNNVIEGRARQNALEAEFINLWRDMQNEAFPPIRDAVLRALLDNGVLL